MKLRLYRVLTPSTSSSDNAWIENTLLVRRCKQLKSEVEVHKWYESEKVGHDIGWDRASINYTVRQVLQHDG